MYYLNVRKSSASQQRKKRRLSRQKQRVMEKIRHNALRLNFEISNCKPFSHQYVMILEAFRLRHEKLLHRLYKLTGVWQDPYSWIAGWVDAREVVLVARELKLVNNYRRVAEAKKEEPAFEDHPRWVEDWDRQAQTNQLIE